MGPFSAVPPLSLCRSEAGKVLNKMPSFPLARLFQPDKSIPLTTSQLIGAGAITGTAKPHLLLTLDSD
jgi:hypothetical protein